MIPTPLLALLASIIWIDSTLVLRFSSFGTTYWTSVTKSSSVQPAIRITNHRSKVWFTLIFITFLVLNGKFFYVMYLFHKTPVKSIPLLNYLYFYSNQEVRRSVFVATPGKTQQAWLTVFPVRMHNEVNLITESVHMHTLCWGYSNVV